MRPDAEVQVMEYLNGTPPPEKKYYIIVQIPKGKSVYCGGVVLVVEVLSLWLMVVLNAAAATEHNKTPPQGFGVSDPNDLTELCKKI